MSLSKEDLKKIVEELDTARRFQRGAWALVQEAGRKYALMKAQGVLIDHNGCRISLSHRDVESYTKQFEEGLLRAAENAFAEDAQMGAAVSNNLG